MSPAKAFKDRFLADAFRQFERRRKAIRKKGGEFEVEQEIAPSFEALLIRVIHKAPRPTVILQLSTKNRLDLYVRSTWRESRGRMLLRVDCARVVSNATTLVEAFERTLDASWKLAPSGQLDVSARECILSLWDELLLQTD